MKTPKSNKLDLIKYIALMIGVFLAIVFIRSFALDYFTVSGGSMQPNLEDKEIVLVNKLSKDYHRGDVVIFNAKGVDATLPSEKGNTYYVKRVIGIPGDTVEFKEGKILVNNKEINQDFLKDNNKDNITREDQLDATGTYEDKSNWDISSLSKSQEWAPYGVEGKTTVPNGKMFVLGDHRSVSSDSRMYSFVPEDKVVGKVKVPFWDSSNKEINSQAKSFWK